MTKRFDWWDLGALILFTYISLLPLQWIHWWETPRNIEIEPEFISGLIALSSIVLGFVTAIITIRRNIRLPVLFMVLANWVLLWYAAWEIFESALGEIPPIDAITWTMCSLVSNFLTATLFFVWNYLAPAIARTG